LWLIGALAVGCSPAAQGTGAPPTALPSSIAPAATSAPDPLATGPLEPCSKNDGKTCLMDAGDYRSTAFRDGVSFTLATSWSNTDNASDLIALFRDDARYGGTRRLEVVGGPVPVGPEPAATPAKTIVDFVTGLDAIGGLTITSVVGLDFGSHASQAYDVENDGAGTVTLFSYATTDGQYHLGAGVTVRIYWLDIAGAPVLVTVEAPTDHFAAFLADQQPFLASIAFGG
jgi:hypothetical protein